MYLSFSPHIPVISYLAMIIHSFIHLQYVVDPGHGGSGAYPRSTASEMGIDPGRDVS